MRFIVDTLCRLQWRRKRPFWLSQRSILGPDAPTSSVIQPFRASDQHRRNSAAADEVRAGDNISRETLDVKISDNLLSLAHEVIEK
jgi:hypothetical protein